MAYILLVEDETNFGIVLQDYLQMQGHKVDLTRDGEEGLKHFHQNTYEICILDVMMPKKDGFSLAQEIRKTNEQIPIIFLTARSLKEDIVKGFRIGADDYITKPFDSQELLLRIEAILKRVKGKEQQKVEIPDEFDILDYHFNYRLNSLERNGKAEKLSPKEADLLRMLCLHENDLLSREEALNTLWGDDNYFNARSMDVFISKLRKRFKETPEIKIINVHGKGFRFMVEKSSD